MLLGFAAQLWLLALQLLSAFLLRVFTDISHHNTLITFTLQLSVIGWCYVLPLLIMSGNICCLQSITRYRWCFDVNCTFFPSTTVASNLALIPLLSDTPRTPTAQLSAINDGNMFEKRRMIWYQHNLFYRDLVKFFTIQLFLPQHQKFSQLKKFA